MELHESNGVDELEAIVEAFEQNRQRQSNANFLDFLPAPSHRQYREIATELVRVDMELSWEIDRRSLEDYCRMLPDLFVDPEVLEQIAYEEFRLRIQQGESIVPEEYGRRYGVSTVKWKHLTRHPDAQFRANAHRAFDSSLNAVWSDALQLADDIADFPAVGDQFLDFHLERELGRGAFARVFLASQRELADRPVVLKIASGKTLESQHLARLQHTNIVPIYSVHQSGRFAAVCMPHFGSYTLADLVRKLDRGRTLPHSGQALLSTVATRVDNTRPANNVDGPARPAQRVVDSEPMDRAQIDRLRQLSYVEAVVQLMLQVAEGLQHAHKRGIVHRDLKPANILLTDDGRAMLLDFNLSEDLIVNGPAALALGGTLPYMAPEHLLAMIQGGAVDFRSDIYSVGVIFFELLTGSQPFPICRGSLQSIIPQMLENRRSEVPSASRLNAKVSPAVAAIVSRCLAADPQDRYESIDELHEDLKSHLANLPLRHAPNTSIRERAVKWARRHPRLSSAASVATVAFALLLAAGAISLRFWAVHTYQEFMASVPTARTALGVPENDPQLIQDGIATVQELIGRMGVGDSAEWHRPLAYYSLGVADREQLKTNLSELAYQIAAATGRIAQLENKPSKFEAALKWNDLAANILPPSRHPRAFALQRADLLESQGKSLEAAEARDLAINLPTQGALDDYLRVQRLIRDGQYDDALPMLVDLRDNSPTDAVHWLLLGNAYAGLTEFDKAEECFSTSAALLPQSYVSRLHRGLCRMDQKEYRLALEDFDEVLELRPELSSCLLNRALAQAALGNHRQAVADFTTALKHGATQTRIYFLRARSYEQIDNAEAAAEDHATGMRLTPTDEESWVARGVARLADEPEGALADFQEALRLNSRSLSALKNIVHVTADRLNRPDEALASLDRILEVEAGNPDALAGRAVLQARQGNRQKALVDVQQLLRVSKEPTHLFQAACALSRTSSIDRTDAPKGLLLLSKAVLQDPRLFVRARTDPDLEQLRKLPKFDDLMIAAKPVL